MPMLIEYYLYYLYYTFLGFPFIIRVAVVALTIFAPFYCFVFLSFAKEKKKYDEKRKLQKVLKNKYADEIKHIITSPDMYYPEDIASRLNCNVKKLSGRKKRIITNILLFFRSKEKNINEENYRSVIIYFNLQQFWEKKLKYGSMASRQRALRKLDDFNIEIPGAVIASLTNNKNQFLRKRARSYYMHLSQNSPFKFLDENFDNTFNQWDKIEIHRILSKKAEDEKLPSLTQWIKNSKNSAFRCFLVDEIKLLNQKESCYYLLEILDTQDMKLRRHCIEALGELKCHLAEKRLMENYQQQPVTVQQSIIKAIQKLNSGEALSFLEEAYFDAHDSESKIIILHAIYNYGTAGRKLFDTMQKEAEGFSRQMFEHVSNPLLSYNLAI
ncbi:HEAT repeat domain-containing protein [Dysgonomonas sp. 511]|uniref:HEAT repeat domain-containing protein n=1 Tax=Dysgonomonas sp. 511 TaxID=2302930 RepID=UPI001C88AC62|nr:HEAT repeat domain-containing protein [Dysgonomonas sp. 511]NDV78347.1 HEAT repeat domain-containing protein [Dysgonomonas sp. 511]